MAPLLLLIKHYEKLQFSNTIHHNSEKKVSVFEGQAMYYQIRQSSSNLMCNVFTSSTAQPATMKTQISSAPPTHWQTSSGCKVNVSQGQSTWQHTFTLPSVEEPERSNLDLSGQLSGLCRALIQRCTWRRMKHRFGQMREETECEQVCGSSFSPLRDC